MLKKIRGRIHSFCYYNRMERNGIVAFVVLLCLLFCGLWLYNKMYKPPVQTNRFFAKVDSLERALKVEVVPPTLEQFNPNLTDSTTFRKLGFSQKQTRNILNYRNAGGYFYAKKDFKKLYFVTDSIFQIYEPYLVIPKKKWKKTKTKKYSEQLKKQKTVRKDTLFYFNPNLITVAQWEQLGISTKVARTVKNYLVKGGQFRKSEDLKIIYGLSDKSYNRLAPYIQIPKPKIAKTKEIVVYDLNVLKASDLEPLRIKPKMAQRIVKFRDLLGGFARLEQLSEVYGIQQFELNILKKHCKIASDVKQININTATLQELKKHPYLDYATARAILRYRKRKGKFTTVETLKNVKILTEKGFEKTKFYLKVEN